MSTHQRRAAKAVERAKLKRIKDHLATVACMNVDELFEDTKRAVRAAFESHGEIDDAFHCITETAEIFFVPASWHRFFYGSCRTRLASEMIRPDQKPLAVAADPADS